MDFLPSDIYKKGCFVLLPFISKIVLPFVIMTKHCQPMDLADFSFGGFTWTWVSPSHQRGGTSMLQQYKKYCFVNLCVFTLLVLLCPCCLRTFAAHQGEKVFGASNFSFLGHLVDASPVNLNSRDPSMPPSPHNKLLPGLKQMLHPVLFLSRAPRVGD